ncbi:hypothetical protein L1987_18859 [Smallanthus sonchifolius]|uniref:Uncharacterized protein n=1 Tax=Smallanthus sonchifolius TaxID=185202 RepID=A0ACB9J338_9ASTR|nr:hypothetical protein L1987_18859 [Smallanthus sonchifolius]
MASDARRRRIAEKGSDRLALITGGRAPNPPTSAEAQSLHSSNALCPPSLTDEDLSEIGGSKVQPVLCKSESSKMESNVSPNKSKHETMKIHLPLVLLLFINAIITVGPLVLDAMKLIQQELNSASEETETYNLGSPFEWGMLFKTVLHAFFMDSFIYSVVVVCATSFFQKFG